jgi:hypothetical protein
MEILSAIPGISHAIDEQIAGPNDIAIPALDAARENDQRVEIEKTGATESTERMQPNKPEDSKQDIIKISQVTIRQEPDTYGTRTSQFCSRGNEEITSRLLQQHDGAEHVTRK